MSRVFSDTSTNDGMVQMYESELGFDYGHVSGNTNRLKRFTADVNSALAAYWQKAIPASGRWQLDDSNHTKYPIIKTNLVSGQRDYAFTTDEQGILILDIYKVFILPSATATLYEEIFPFDQQSDKDASDLNSETTATGVPNHYDKTANGIFLDPTPSYNSTRGLKVHINREASEFVTSDTTKMPGVPGIHHDYFWLRPARDYARRYSLKSLNDLERMVLYYEGDESRGIEGEITRYFSRREKDERPCAEMEQINYE